jgi:hypothetical protein
MTRALCHFDNAYWLPDVAMHGFSGKTNTQSNTAFRGFGGPQGAIAIENILDSVARTLGRDPMDVRRINFYGKKEHNVTPYGQLVNDNIMPPIGVLLGGVDFSSFKIVLKDATLVPPAPEVAIRYGAFISTCITFVVVALVVFMIARLLIKEGPPPAVTTCPFCKESNAVDASKCKACASTI